MREIRDWLPAVAAAHEAGADDWVGDDVTVRRVTGGFNNALYRVAVDGQSYVCKLCVADGRRRAAREHNTFRLLHAAGLELAPQPLWLDESCTVLPFPTVVYHWLPGRPLDSPPTPRQLVALLEGYHNIHALRQRDYAQFGILDAWFHWLDFEPYLVELRGFLAEYGTWLATAEPDGQDLRDRLARLVNGCTEALTATDVDPSRESVPLCLCRVDPNLANGVWDDDGRLRWVDWEYSGWGDPALDLAELRWHAALEDLHAEQHRWLRDNYRRPSDDPAFDARVVVWDHIISTRWAFLVLRHLWSQYNGPDRVRLSQTPADPAQVRARLARFIGRAERLAERTRGAKP